MSKNNGGKSVFSRHIADSLEKEQPVELLQTPLAQKLLDWSINYWSQPTISMREIRAYGPNSIRDWKIARTLTEILVRQGWFTPLKTHRYDRSEWRIVRNKLSD
jgi:hypothetical protein